MKQEKHQIDNPTLHLKQLEKEEQKTPKISGRKIIKIQAEINENEEIIVKINKTKSWFFEKINKIYKHLATLIREGNGTLLQYSRLENPMDGKAW